MPTVGAATTTSFRTKILNFKDARSHKRAKRQRSATYYARVCFVRAHSCLPGDILTSISELHHDNWQSSREN